MHWGWGIRTGGGASLGRVPTSRQCGVGLGYTHWWGAGALGAGHTHRWERRFRASTHRRGRLLQAVEQVDDARLLLDALHLLRDGEVGRPRAPHVHRHRPHEGAASKVLDLLRHRRREQQRLALALRGREVTVIRSLL